MPIGTPMPGATSALTRSASSAAIAAVLRQRPLSTTRFQFGYVKTYSGSRATIGLSAVPAMDGSTGLSGMLRPPTRFRISFCGAMSQISALSHSGQG